MSEMQLSNLAVKQLITGAEIVAELFLLPKI